jgi:hypothetical protein
MKSDTHCERCSIFCWMLWYGRLWKGSIARRSNAQRKECRPTLIVNNSLHNELDNERDGSERCTFLDGSRQVLRLAGSESECFGFLTLVWRSTPHVAVVFRRPTEPSSFEAGFMMRCAFWMSDSVGTFSKAQRESPRHSSLGGRNLYPLRLIKSHSDGRFLASCCLKSKYRRSTCSIK